MTLGHRPTGVRGPLPAGAAHRTQPAFGSGAVVFLDSVHKPRLSNHRQRVLDTASGPGDSGCAGMAGFVGKTAQNRCPGRAPVADAGVCPGGSSTTPGPLGLPQQGARNDNSPSTSQHRHCCRLCCRRSRTGQRRPECVRRPWLSLPGDGKARQPGTAGRDESRHPRWPRCHQLRLIDARETRSRT